MDQSLRTHAPAGTRAQAVARRVHVPERTEAESTPYIGLVTRLLAFAIDAFVINAVAIVVGAVVALVFSILPPVHVAHGVVAVIGGAAFALWVVGYFIAFWTTTGQTPGDRLLEFKIVREDGTLLRPRHALLRLFGMILSAPLLIGFLPILVTARRRGLHDWLAGSVAVGAPASERV